MYTNKELVSKLKRYRKKCCNHLKEIHGLEVELANQETKFRAKLDAALRRIKQLEQKRDPISPPSPVSPVVATAFVKTQWKKTVEKSRRGLTFGAQKKNKIVSEQPVFGGKQVVNKHKKV